MNQTSIRIDVRNATEADLRDVADMVDICVHGHPAATRPRPLSRLREAYFGPRPVAKLLVATRVDRVVGMAQWTRLYDMFWGMYCGEVEWLFVRPEARGLGVPASLLAEICRQVRLDGGEFIKGAAESDGTAALYERVALGWPARTVNVGGAAFHAFADLAGLAPREIVRRLPEPALNRVDPEPR